MADPYGTEEEQLRAIKDWWNRNGSSTLIGVGLAIALVSGWNWWQQNQQENATAAALLFQQLDQAVALSRDDPVQRATAEHLAQTLQAEHNGTRYGHYGQLLLARLLVESKDLNRAEAVLRELLTVDADNEISELATLRLARVQFAAGDGEAALKTLNASNPGAFASQYAELRGDVHVSLDQIQEAIAAYQEAAAAAQQSGLLRIKLDGLKTTATSVESGAGLELDAGALAP